MLSNPVETWGGKNVMKEKVIVWGTGLEGMESVLLLREFYDIEFFVDSDVSKQGSLFFGYEVHSPKELSEHQDAHVIITTSLYYFEIKALCIDMGVNNVEYFGPWNIHVNSDELLDYLNKNRSIDIGRFLLDSNNQLGG